MWGLPQKQNASRADKIRLCGHLRRYKKIVKKTYIICKKNTNELSTQIGLRNSKAIMERHSGNLEIIDAKDTFEVVLRFPVIWNLDFFRFF